MYDCIASQTLRTWGLVMVLRSVQNSTVIITLWMQLEKKLKREIKEVWIQITLHGRTLWHAVLNITLPKYKKNQWINQNTIKSKLKYIWKQLKYTRIYIPCGDLDLLLNRYLQTAVQIIVALTRMITITSTNTPRTTTIGVASVDNLSEVKKWLSLSKESLALLCSTILAESLRSDCRAENTHVSYHITMYY